MVHAFGFTTPDEVRKAAFGFTYRSSERKIYLCAVDGVLPAHEKSGCFIATAAYGSPMANEVAFLRYIRDRYLEPSAVGKRLVRAYYLLSPPIARELAKKDTARLLVRSLVLGPLVRAMRACSVLVGREEPRPGCKPVTNRRSRCRERGGE